MSKNPQMHPIESRAIEVAQIATEIAENPELQGALTAYFVASCKNVSKWQQAATNSRAWSKVPDDIVAGMVLQYNKQVNQAILQAASQIVRERAEIRRERPVNR